MRPHVSFCVQFALVLAFSPSRADTQHIATNCNTLQHTAVLDGLLPECHSTFHNNPHFLNGTAGGNFGRVCVFVYMYLCICRYI